MTTEAYSCDYCPESFDSRGKVHETVEHSEETLKV